MESHLNGTGEPVPKFYPRLDTFMPAPQASTPEHQPVIKAAAGDTSRLSLDVAADDLLSHCWSKACEFARSFGASQISIEFLLLGASHVRDAEPVLATACPDAEMLSHALATRCARRSFSPVPTTNTGYQADKTLKGLLCGTAAIAATQEMPRLTLSLLLEAVALHHPTLPVLELLPTLQKAHQQQPSSAVLLEQIADRLETIENQITGPQVEALEQAFPFSQRDGLADTVAKLQRDVATLKGHLIYDPSGTANPFEPQRQPHLVIPSREEMVRVIAELPKRIANAVLDELKEQQPRRPAENKVPPAKGVLGWLRNRK